MEKAQKTGIFYDFIFVLFSLGGKITRSSHVSYTNNDVQSGEVIVTNTRTTSQDYELPETGGIGTNRFTAVGLALMAGSLMCGYVMRRKRRERRGI